MLEKVGNRIMYNIRDTHVKVTCFASGEIKPTSRQTSHAFTIRNRILCISSKEVASCTIGSRSEIISISYLKLNIQLLSMMLARSSHPQCLLLSCPRRTFTSTATPQLQRGKKVKANAEKLLPKHADPPPPYPYDHSYFYKQSNYGLYGGAMIQFGNNVAPKSKHKSRRRWHPNIVHKQLFSRALGRTLRLKVRTRVLRTIDKVGGLDEYLLGGTSARLKELGEEGWRLRWAILQSPAMKKRLKEDTRLRGAVGSMARGLMADRKVLPGASMAAIPALEEAVVETAAEVEQDAVGEESEIDVEERIRRHLDENTHMREQPAPVQSWWQTITGFITRPFRRGG